MKKTSNKFKVTTKEPHDKKNLFVIQDGEYKIKSPAEETLKKFKTRENESQKTKDFTEETFIQEI